MGRITGDSHPFVILSSLPEHKLNPFSNIPQVIKSIVQYSIPFFLGLAQAINSVGAMMSSDENSNMGSVNGNGSNMAPPPPPPPLYKDFWGNKEQYQVKSPP